MKPVAEKTDSRAPVRDAQLEALRQREFPLTEAWCYFDHASRGPLPASHVAAANLALARQMLTVGGRVSEVLDRLDAIRELGARLVNAAPADIAVLTSTGHGTALVAQGLDWREGDEVITYANEYPTLVLPWLQLRDRGVQVRFVEDRGCRYEIEDVEALISPKTRVVALSLVNFAHGFRAPLEEIGRLCMDRGIWFVVDACQALGAVPVDAVALGADIVSAHAYKHLLGGFGISLCYCSPRARAELRVTGAGASGRDRETIIGSVGFEEPLSRDARRFESSFPNSAASAGFLESLRLLVDGLGAPYHERIAHFAGALVDGVRELGWVVESSLREGERSSVIAITRPETDLARVQHELLTRRIVVAHRAGFLRMAPHFYNTADEVEALLAELSSH